jgi:PLP dependent protein
VTTIKNKLTSINNEIGNCKLIAVSKYTTNEKITEAYDAGHRIFGESKVQDLKKKSEIFPEDIEWHFIGHLQKNKVNNLIKIPGFRYLHSVDSLELLNMLYKKEDNISSGELNIFLQLNTSGESEKSGFNTYDELARAANLILSQDSSTIKLIGLMTIGKIRTEAFETDAISCFQELTKTKKRLEHEFGFKGLKLSMGMSGDYKLAVAEGADYIRVGSTIFS